MSSSIDKLNQAGNPPLQDLSLLRCASRFGTFERGELNGHSVYQIKKGNRVNPLHAVLNKGQVKWSSAKTIYPSDIEQVIEFTVDNRRSLLINGGTHGTRTGETVCDNPELGDTKILLEVAEKIDNQQAFLHVAFHVVSRNAPPLTHEQYPNVDIMDGWCFSSQTDVENYSLSNRVKEAVEQLFRDKKVSFDVAIYGKYVNYFAQAQNVTISQHIHHETKESPKTPSLSFADLLNKLKATYITESHIIYMHSSEKEENVCDSFINLAILTQKEVKEAEKPQKEKQIDNRDLYYNSFEALYQTKESIGIKDIFSALGKDPVKKQKKKPRRQSWVLLEKKDVH